MQLERNCLCSKVAFAIGAGRVPHKSFLFQAQSPAKKKKQHKPKQKTYHADPILFPLVYTPSYFNANISPW